MSIWSCRRSTRNSSRLRFAHSAILKSSIEVNFDMYAIDKHISGAYDVAWIAD